MDKTTGVVIALCVLCLLAVVFRGRIKARLFGMRFETESEKKDTPPAKGVNLSGAEFKDKNKFAADNESRVNAQNMKAGTGNEFKFGSPDRENNSRN